MEKRAFLVGLFAAVAASATLPAAEWFVSPEGTDAAGGGTEATPFRTINYAIDKASANDVVTLLPGDHVEGCVTNDSLASRVLVSKTLTLRSKGRAYRDATRIVGAYDDNAASTGGLGPAAVRCVDVEAAGVRIEGVTFYRGATDYANNSGAAKTEGGGVYVASTATIVDCAFVECRSTRGGGAFSGAANNASLTVVRCLFLRCLDTKFGAGLRGGAAYNCVFDDCGTVRVAGAAIGEQSNAKHAISYSYRAVNCTFVNNEGAGVQANGSTFVGGVCNCLFQNNGDAINGTPSGTSASNTANSAYTTRLNVFSPYDGDYRLTVDSDGLGAGSAEYLELIPEEFRGMDYYGNPRTTGGVVHAGAVQDALTEAASGIGFSGVSSGKYFTDGSWTLGGEPVAVAYRTWRGTVGWPVPQRVGFVPAGGSALVRYTIGNTPVWPLRDDVAWVHPVRAGIAQTVNTVLASAENVFWADPVNGDDENDGTAAAPFKTLNKAVQATNATHVVFAKAGDYCNAEERVASSTNRVVVPSSLAGELRVVAVAGPDQTFITGRAGTADAANKTGNDAIRCVAVAASGSHYVAFQGFTLRDGHSAGTTEAGTQTLGGAFHNLTSGGGSSLGTAWLLDCVIRGCTARRGGAAAGGTLMRCRIEDCFVANASGGGLFRHCNVISSLVIGCGGSSEIFAGGSTAYNVTTYGCTVPALYNGTNGSGNLRNSVLTGRADANWDLYGSSNLTDDGVQYCLYSKAGGMSAGVTLPTSVKEDPARLVNPDSGNYRLSPSSAGVALASPDYLMSCMDIEGSPYTFAADGRYEAGCYAVRTPATVYADAVNGDDENGDGSATAPFATLAAAMAAAGDGDTVIAFPGTYASGTMVPTLAQAGGSVTPTIAARVVVKPGVTLESRDGAAATVIQGAAATGGGCGDDAVRCVFLCKGATLRGFTVTGGYTAATSLANGADTMTVDNYGGGVAGYYVGNDMSVLEFAEFVEDCVITNNMALRAGGAQYGIYRNCSFVGNSVCSGKPGSAVSRLRAEGCYFAGNGNTSQHSAVYDCALYNCTVRANQAQTSAAVISEGSYKTGRAICNTVIEATKINLSVMTNCLLSSATRNSYGGDPATNMIFVGDALLDAAGVPQAGSAAIDAGDMSLTPAALGDTDLAGVQRVYNGKIDIGCFEFDWRPKYAAILGKGLAVTAASPEVYAVGESAVAVPGGSLEVEWANANGSRREFSGLMNVTGTGTLTAARGDEAFAALTSADGEQAFKFFSSDPLEKLSFAYAPGESDTGAALLSAFGASQGLTIILR